MPRYPIPNTVGRTPHITVASSTALNQSYYDFICDGVDDDVQIQAALNSLPSTGGTVELSEGIFYGNKATALITLTGASIYPNRHLKGQGNATSIRQSGAGSVLAFLDGTDGGGGEVSAYMLQDFAIDGQNVASYGIDLQNAKDCLIERIGISGCLDHSIYVHGLSCLNNVVRGPGRFTSGLTTDSTKWLANQAASAIRSQGNRFSVSNVYFNIGGNHTTKTVTGATNATPIVITSAAHGLSNNMRVEIRGVLGNTAANGDWVVANVAANTFELAEWETSAEAALINSIGNGVYTSGGTIYVRRYTTAWNQGPAATGTSRSLSVGNIYDGCVFGIATRQLESYGDYVDITSPTGSLKAFVRSGPGGNNQITVFGGGVSNFSKIVYAGPNSDQNLDIRNVIVANDDEHSSNSGGMLLGATVSPAQIAANQNNYNPTDGRWALIWRLNSDASRNITGLATGGSGKHLTIINVGSFDIVLTNQDVLSTAANRIITGTGASITLTPDTSRTLVYDNTSSRWRVIS